MNKSFECPHFPRCSGCTQTQGVDQPPILTEIRQFFDDLGFPNFSLNVGSITGWRTRAKLAVRGSSQIPLIGLYKAGSHDVINIPFCKVHHPKINEAVNFIKSWIRKESIEPYSEIEAKGLLRYLQLTVQRNSGKIQLVLVLNCKDLNEHLRKAIENLNTYTWHSIWINFNERRDNVIFGDQWTHFEGDPWLRETIAGTEVCFHPSSFAQGNFDAFEELVKKIQKMISSEECVAEYYAGVGVIGLSLAKQYREIKCSEINAQAEICFEESKKKLSKESQSKITFKCGPSKNQLEWLNQVHSVIVDPPRKGLETALLEALTNADHLKKLIYISCGWEGFKKDCLALTTAGWKIAESEGFLFFPGTNQVEIMTLFT